MIDANTKVKSAALNCPCGTGQAYTYCCQPRHDGSKPSATAEQLMRSRYSAYTLSLWQYLYDTGPQTGSAEQEQAEMVQWCTNKQWLGLKLLSSQQGKEQDIQGTVEFVAFYRDSSKRLEQHHEFSYFDRINNAWRFARGEGLAPIAIGRNEPCPCGSGKKFKRCCND